MATDPFGTATVHAPMGMVASADHLASGAGVAILRAGGTAADAAVAAGAVLAVTNQHQNGMGGDLFALVHQPGQPPVALCAAGRAGQRRRPDPAPRRGPRPDAPLGDIRSATVPGCVDGWVELHGRYGRLSLAQVLEPAIDLRRARVPGLGRAGLGGDGRPRPARADDYDPAWPPGAGWRPAR